MSVHQALPADVEQMIKAAMDGDTRALGRLYGMTGAFLRGPSRAVPEPLASLVAGRLAALADALVKKDRKDYRPAVVSAVTPWNRRGRRKNIGSDEVPKAIAALRAIHAARGGQVASKGMAQEVAALDAGLSLGSVRRGEARVPGKPLRKRKNSPNC